MTATPIVWTGRVLSGLFVLFMLGASVAPKLLGMPVAFVASFVYGQGGLGVWCGLAAGLAFVAVVLTARFARLSRVPARIS